jgi:SIR2-like domain
LNLPTEAFGSVGFSLRMLTKWGKLIPPTLLDTLRDSNRLPVFFIGSGFGQEAVPPLKTATGLADAAFAQLGINSNGEGLAEILQYLKNSFGNSHARLVDWLKQQLLYGKAKPGGAHHLALRLATRTYVTTNYDTLLLDAAKHVPDKAVVPISDAASLNEQNHPPNTVMIAHIHGSFLNAKSIVACTDGFIEYLRKDEWRTTIEEFMHRRTIVFLGYSLRDFTTWWSYISALLRYYDDMPPHVLVSPSTGSHLASYWEKYHVQYVPLTAARFLIGVHDALGTLRDDVAIAGAAACLQLPMSAVDPELAKLRLQYRYTDKSLAALRVIEEASV